MLNRLLIIHGGGPTCVLNASTYGVIREAQKHPEKIGGVFGCMGGVGGLLKRDFRRLDCLGQEKLEQLKSTPGTVIGSSRYPLAESDYARLADVLREEGFSPWTVKVTERVSGFFDTDKSPDSSGKSGM